MYTIVLIERLDSKNSLDSLELGRYSVLLSNYLVHHCPASLSSTYFSSCMSCGAFIHGGVPGTAGCPAATTVGRRCIDCAYVSAREGFWECLEICNSLPSIKNRNFH